MQHHHIGIMYLSAINNSLFDDFMSSIGHAELNIKIELRADPGPYACTEWLIPTAIIAFISKAYFEEFLKEMGRDHYNILKSSLAKLTEKSITQPRIEPTLFGSPGKLKPNYPYSLAYSIMAEAKEGQVFKLLIPKYSSDIDYKDITLKFIDFMSDYYILGDKSLASVAVRQNGAMNKTILVHCNPDTQLIEWLDPLPPEVREKIKQTPK